MLSQKMKMQNLITISVLVLIIIFGLVNLASSDELAKIDQTVIDDNYFKFRINLLPSYVRNRMKIDKERFLNKLIDEELFYREAKKLNLDKREDFQRKLEAVKRELLVDYYLSEYLKKKNTIEAQKGYYEKNKEKYRSPEKVRIAVISVESEEKAKEILEKLKKGEDFAELAKKYSKGLRAKMGGDYGFRTRRGLRKDFVDIAFSMKKGEIKGPIKAKDGYHIIKLLDRKPEAVIPFEKIRYKVASDYWRKLLGDKIKELRNTANIRINEEALKKLKIN